MALNKKLIHFQKLADFNTQLAAGNILDTSIIFIKDAKQIYTHGQLYSCSYTESELQELLNNKADATDLTDILTQANQYTDDKVANLVGQAPEALDTVYELAEAMATNQDAVDVLNEAIGKKVDKVAGKGLSTNDYTTAEKDKLAGIAQGATANIGTITGIKMNGASRGSAGVVDLGTVITEHQDISGKLDSEVASATYLKKTDATNTYQLIGDYATKSEIPTKVSQLENDVPYALKSDVEVEMPDGVYAVDANGKLIDYNSADATALGVALVAGEHKFMIAKSDAIDGSNSALHWGKNLHGKDVAGITNISSGAGYIGEGKKYGTDFTTWSTGPVVDFNGTANTAAIIAGYTEHGVSMEARDMCTVLNTFNASDSFKDWYVPACGQLALMFLNKTEINAALAKIGGTAFELDYYWSSSEYNASSAWSVVFSNGYVSNRNKGNNDPVRFVRDISVSKPLKERVSELEELNAILVDTEEEADDPIVSEYVSLDVLETRLSEEIPTKTSQLTNDSGFLTQHQDISNLATKASAVSNITRSGNTFTATKADGNTFTFTQTDTTYSANNGITLSGTTFGLTSGIVTAGSKGPTAAVTGNNNTTVAIPRITVDTYGRVTRLTSYNLTCKNTTYSAATTSANGLMSSTDKSRLDFMHSSSAVTTLASLPAKAVVTATLSAATTISLASALTVGQSITVICTPTASFTQPIPTSGSFISMDGDSLSVTSGKVFEINILCYASGKYSISCKTAV